MEFVKINITIKIFTFIQFFNIFVVLCGKDNFNNNLTPREMSNDLFIYKDNSKDNCVKYIETISLKEYVSIIFKAPRNYQIFPVVGPGFNNYTVIEELDFNSITTILNKDDFKNLLTENSQSVIDKLLSKENSDLFSKVIMEEKEFLKKEHNLLDSELELIFDTYSNRCKRNFRDRNIFLIYDSMADLMTYLFEPPKNNFSDNTNILTKYPEEDNEEYYNDLKNAILSSSLFLELPSKRIIMFKY